ncbi:MAG: DUF530 domain-containing protein [Methanobacteriaceae archaeon]|nr:DUF530 domain-containing protein [Methanobacteriaceae archaeon]
MSESFLVAQTEKFLKEIQKQEIPSNITNFNEFIDLYITLKNNLIKLQDIRNEMEIRGYSSPYRSLKRYGKMNATNDVVAEDFHDQSRHAQYFRMKASTKKNILDQVKSAIASHKIAIGHLEEDTIIKCNKCNQTYSKHTLDNLLVTKNQEYTGYQCPCNSHKLTYEKNEKGICKIDLIRYLPLAGDYMLKRSELSSFGKESYRNIIHILKQEKRGIVKSVTAVVKVKEENGKTVRHRVNIDYADESSYEREVRKRYGAEAKIEFLQFHHKKPSLINDKHVQTSLAIAYIKYSENIIKKNIDEIVLDHTHNIDKVEKYYEIQENARCTSRKLARTAEERIELEKDIFILELKKENLIHNDILDRELKEDLKKQDEISEYYYTKTPRTLIIWDIFKYYLTTSVNRRTSYAGPFPNLRPTLDTNQMKAFDEKMPKNIINLLKENNENILYIPNLKEIIQYKQEIETKQNNLHIRIDHACCAAVAINIKTDIGLEKSAHLFNLNMDQVTKEKQSIQKIEKPKTNKAKKFLEMIK